MTSWEDLAHAHARQEAARRELRSHPLDVTSLRDAEDHVRDRERACGALFAELMLHAIRSEDVRGYVGRLLERLEPADDYARGLCQDLAGCVEWLSEELLAHRHALVDVRREVEGVKRELEMMRHEQQQEREATGAERVGSPEQIAADRERSVPRVVG